MWDQPNFATEETHNAEPSINVDTNSNHIMASVCSVKNTKRAGEKLQQKGNLLRKLRKLLGR
jgi:hypothetical protein